MKRRDFVFLFLFFSRARPREEWATDLEKDSNDLHDVLMI